MEQNLKTLPWRHRLQSRKPCQNFLPKSFCHNQKTIAKVPGIVKKLSFFEKSVLCKNVALETRSYDLTNMPKLFRQTPKVFSQRPESMKSITTYSLQKHHFACKWCSRNDECCFNKTGKNFFWKQSMNFWLEVWKWQKFFLLMKKNFRPKMFLWSHEKQFWQPFRESFRSKKYKKSKTCRICPKTIPKIVPLDT